MSSITLGQLKSEMIKALGRELRVEEISPTQSFITRSFAPEGTTYMGKPVVCVDYDAYRDRKAIMTQDGMVYLVDSLGRLEGTGQAFPRDERVAVAQPLTIPKAEPKPLTVEEQIDDAIQAMRAKA